MDEFESTIRITLKGTSKFDTAKVETVRKEVVQMFQKKLKTARIITWVGIGIGGVLEVTGLVGLVLSMFFANTIRPMVLFGVIALSGGQFHLLAKLWYWIVNSKLNMLKEIKQLQLQIAELTGKEPPAEN